MAKRVYVGVPGGGSTLLLLHGDTLSDSSNYGRVITNSGVTVSSAQSKFGGKSLYFDGSSYLTVPQLLSGNSPFTIEAWIYPIETKANTIWSHDGSNATAVTGGVLEFYISNNVIYYCSGFHIQPSTSYALNTWHHVALVGDGLSIKLFVNGKLNGTYSGAYNFCHAVEMFGANSDALGSENFKGYMDEIRVSNVARWTSDFTPPTSPHEVSNEGGQGVARQVKKIYLGVNGVARQTKKGYIGVNGVARLFFENGYKITVTGQSNFCTVTLQDGTVVPAGTHVYTLPEGYTITVQATSNNWKKPGSVYLNGVKVANPYTYTVVSEATIQRSGWSSGGDNPDLGGTINITDMNG